MARDHRMLSVSVQHSLLRLKAKADQVIESAEDLIQRNIKEERDDA